MSQTFEASARIRLLHGVNRLYTRCFHRVTVSGVCRVPRRGPAIIASNHISALDPLVVQSVVHRPIIWMMAREYYDLPVLGRIFRTVQAIPVTRDGKDSTALRAALRTLAGGHVLGIFPEGRIETGRELLPLQTGLALIALRTRVPVLPVVQDGTTRNTSMHGVFGRPQAISVRFGESIHLAANGNHARNVEIATKTIENALRSLQTH